MDISILKFFNISLASSGLDIFFSLICDFNFWRWPMALTGIALLWKGGGKGRWAVGLAIITAAIVDPSIYRIIKPLAGRIRPCHDPSLDWVRAVAGCGGKYSFPSSHAANLFGLTLIFGYFYKSTRYYLVPVAILVGIGRVYLGVHYPSDVLAGAIYGSLIAIGVIYISRKIAGRALYKYLKPGIKHGQDNQNHKGRHL